MSPLTLRRYRAERLLRGEFEALRGRVMTVVRGRLRSSGVELDSSDLEACYAQAWQGLYMAVLEGEEISNPTGWLVLVTFRRAIEESRARTRFGGADGQCMTPAPDPDLAGELDDRVRLRQLFEALRGRLNEREREAAVLCYLQGLTRAQAAARMGVSEARLRKLMEGPGAARPGVAGKVGSLVQTIRDGGWCEEQSSSMRALAFGILDPSGERYRLALMHRSECPSCRAYVASLRGLASVLPPVFIPGGVGVSVLAHIGEGGGAAGMSASAGAGSGVQLGRGLGGSLAAPGAAGAGTAAGGGWLFAGGGPLAGKLAIGCVLALTVGAGCVAIDAGTQHGVSHRRHRGGRVASARVAAQAGGSPLRGGATPPVSSPAVAGARAASTSASVPPSAKATREFGPEQVGTGSSAATVTPHSGVHAVASAVGSGSSREAVSAAAAGAPTSPSTSAGAAQAAREFSPG